MHALLYRDIFSYPLTAEGVYKNLNRNSTNVNEVDAALTQLEGRGLISKHNGFFGLGDIQSKVTRRLEGNKRAEKMLPTALRWSRFISGFPFVRGVLLSGSLSKNYMEQDGDIDYFIITTENRLWIARSLLILFKKIFLLNSHKYFCVNYFVDENHLEIEEKNQFTATEVVTLLPICGSDLYRKFVAANSWANKYYPNIESPSSAHFDHCKNGPVKRIFESVFSGALGERLDHVFMSRTIGHWKKKFKDFEASRFDIALKSRRYVSKHHPNDYQKKVLDRFSSSLEQSRKDLLQSKLKA